MSIITYYAWKNTSLDPNIVYTTAIPPIVTTGESNSYNVYSDTNGTIIGTTTRAELSRIDEEIPVYNNGVSIGSYERSSSDDVVINLYMSNFSDGTNSYEIKDATARNELVNKQDTLVSGTNIKTVNSISLLGSGNIDIQGGGASYTAGTGIDITNNVISVDGETVSTVTLATVATTGAFSDLSGTSGVQTTTNLVTSVSSSSTDTQYPSAKLLYDTIGNIETLLAAI